MDIVIPFRSIGTGETDLQYSLRSVQKNLEGWRTIHIVGDRPKWLNRKDRRINHIKTKQKKTKGLDLGENIIAACRRDDVEEDFILMHDDNYLLRRISVDEIPVFIIGDLRNKLARLPPGVPYKTTVNNTLSWLEEKGLPIRDYGTHGLVPMKKAFIMELKEPITKTDGGVECKSLYGNYTNLPYESSKYGFKIKRRMDLFKIHKLPFISINNLVSVRFRSVSKYLSQEFSAPCEWENDVRST